MNIACFSARHVAWLAAILGVLTANCANAAPAEQVFDTGRVKIHYFLAGRGSTVVLMHGLHSSARMNWLANGVFAELAKDHQVIALDLPGHGQSDKPRDEQAYGQQVVADIVSLLDHLQIEQAHLVGYSLGGMIVMKMLALHPERTLSGLVGGMGWLRAGSRLQQIWERIPAREATRTPPEFIHTIGQFAVSEEDLKQIRVPVEIVVGERDPVQRLYVAPLRTVRPDWPVVPIADAGHVDCIAKPQFRTAIANWVRKQKK